MPRGMRYGRVIRSDYTDSISGSSSRAQCEDVAMNLNVAWFKEQKLTRKILGDYLKNPGPLPSNTVALIEQKSRGQIQAAYDEWDD